MGEENRSSKNKHASVSREKLYEEVWAEPMTKVALRYDVSGSFLARICTRLNVPRPSRGYWAMLSAGIKARQSPLPAEKPGDELEWVRNGYPRVAQFPLPKPGEINVVKSRRCRPLQDHHPVLYGAKQLLTEGQDSRDGLLKPRKGVLVDIIVSKETVDRALEVANELFLSLEKRGLSVVIEPNGQNFKRHPVNEREKGVRRQHEYSDLWCPSRSTLVFVGTVAFGLTIFEMTENVEVEYRDGKYTRVSDLPTKPKRNSSSYSWRSTSDLPSGRLCLQVYSPYPRTNWVHQWREMKSGDFPRKLSGVVKELKAEAGEIARLVEEGERKAEIERQQREAQRRESERKEAERQWLKAIEDSHAELQQIIQSWSDVKRIESFFTDAEQQVTEFDSAEKDLILERLKLAREMVGCTKAIKWFADWRTPEERLKAEQERLANLFRGKY